MHISDVDSEANNGRDHDNRRHDGEVDHGSDARAALARVRGRPGPPSDAEPVVAAASGQQAAPKGAPFPLKANPRRTVDVGGMSAAQLDQLTLRRSHPARRPFLATTRPCLSTSSRTGC